ncbi:ABC transporter permease [Zunongwangia sp. H14]|uniref:ABC transporter permease n=1 Tax=Zunongwangia sp. H14 TaxID=3240792 RepID=UPI0035625A16
MIRNYLKVALRNIVRHPVYSTLNTLGLALGFTVCFLIALFVRDEYQFDSFVPQKEQIFRVYSQYADHNNIEERAPTPPMMAPTLAQNFPEVENTARVMMYPEIKRLFKTGDTKIYNEHGYFADTTFFHIFKLEFLYGSREQALNGPASLVISKKLSTALFGNQNPVGKELEMEGTTLKVTGVFKKNPKFHLQFDYIMPLSLAGIPAERMQSWGWQQFYNYVKVREGTNVDALESKFQKLAKTEMRKFDPESQAESTPFLQPLADIHLMSANFKFDMAKRGNITYVKALTFIAIFILLIACFNFVNLATSQSLQRAREVGVRKSIGASRKQLLVQFILETLFLTTIGMLLALVFSLLALPWLNAFTAKSISFYVFIEPVTILAIVLLSIFVGLLAGFYPALVLSNFKPVKVLKGSSNSKTEQGHTPILRHSLVVIQFSLSVLLIISAIVVYNQVDYLHNKDLGFNKEQIMFFPMRGDKMFENREAFKNQLNQVPGVSSVSIGYGFPGDAVAGDGIQVKENGQLVNHPATQLMVDYDYIQTLGLKVIAGRDFSEEMGTDASKAYVINETAVKNLGFISPEKALGQKMYWKVWTQDGTDSIKEGEVIGVVKDFNYKSLYDQVETAVLQIFPDAAWKVAVKLNTANLETSLTRVEHVWDNFSPDYPLEFKFLDENFEQMYQSEDKLRSLLAIFTAVAIFVGCLGLFGLAAFSAERRKREIGIRKVLGALKISCCC